MSQNPQKPKQKIVAGPEKAIIINQPMVRNYSTGGGQSHRPAADTSAPIMRLS